MYSYMYIHAYMSEYFNKGGNWLCFDVSEHVLRQKSDPFI